MCHLKISYGSYTRTKNLRQLASHSLCFTHHEYLCKEHFRNLQTSKQHLVGIKIKTAVNEKSLEKTLKQLKDKIQNLKDAYKAARNNSKKTGAWPTYNRYFEDVDEVLGTRDVINAIFAREVGVLNQDDISGGRDKGNFILFKIYFSEGREKC